MDSKAIKKLYITSNSKIIKNTMQIEIKPLLISYNFRRFNYL